MLFPYTYVPHSMGKMQSFIDFIFFAVWGKARNRGPYGLHLFAANAKLYTVMKSFHYSHTQGADFFNSHVESIYKTFQALPPGGVRQLRRWYKGNNDVEKICANDPRTPLVRYADIEALYPQLAGELETFFRGLYDRLDIAAIKKQIGDIEDHYKTFMQTNQAGKCPFCGLSDLLGPHHSKRDAYDHYLPQKFYPFNTVNFHNLVPACHHCNSSYKGMKDTAFTPKDPCGAQTRRKMFYPFSLQPWRIEVQVSFRQNPHERLEPNDITLAFGPPELAQQIDTWKDVYGIEEVYRAT